MTVYFLDVKGNRKLEIMKDSRIGSFWCLLLFVFVTLLKWQLLTAIPTAEFIPMALIMMPLMSRWSLVLSIRSYPYAREQGMGAAFANLAPKHVITYNTLSTFFMPIVILLIGVILYTLLYGVYSIFSIADVGYVVGLGVCKPRLNKSNDSRIIDSFSKNFSL